MSARKFVASALEVLHIFDLLARVQRPTLLILNYHRLFDAPLDTQFDEGVFSHSRETFHRQMRWLKANVDVLSEADVLAVAAGERELNRRSVMITFDDGYRDNFDIAFPILRDLGIPATFFVPYNQIEGKALPWWDQIAYMVKQSDRSEIKVGELALSIATQKGGRTSAVDTLLRVAKNTPIDQVQDFLDALSRSLGVPLPDPRVLAAQFMSWEQIKEVSQKGVAIGSHSMNHHVLTQLPPDQQRWELAESKRLLESRLDRPVHSLAYPVGGRQAFNTTIKELARECGYRIAFSFTRGYHTHTITDPFEIHRVISESTDPLFKAQVFVPELFCSAS